MSDEMKQDIETMKRDIGTLKTDVSVLTADVSVLKTDVSVLKTDVSALRVTTRNIAVKVSRLEAQGSGLETRLDEKLSKGFGDVLSKLDSFAGEIKASRDERALHGQNFSYLNDRLINHERRLTQLEPPVVPPEKKS